jgi:4-aminobutyrate aminotransferase-like enzyme
MIADEIFTGFGRTGVAFAVQKEAAEPDLLCFGKALGGGLPIAGVLGRAGILDAWSSPGEARHTATFVAHPLACAAALAVLDVLKTEDLAARGQRLGTEVTPRLSAWPQLFSALDEVRGNALLWGLEIQTKAQASRLVRAARERGLLLLAGGPDGRVAQIVPPLNLHRSQLTAALDILETCLAEISE